VRGLLLRASFEKLWRPHSTWPELVHVATAARGVSWEDDRQSRRSLRRHMGSCWRRSSRRSTTTGVALASRSWRAGDSRMCLARQALGAGRQAVTDQYVGRSDAV